MQIPSDAECWARLRDAWVTYCKQGAGVFDWDSDSRALMTELTGERAFQWHWERTEDGKRLLKIDG